MQILNRVARSLKPLVERFPLVARTYRHVRDLQFVNRDPVLTPFGFYFSGDPSMENGSFEAEEIEIVSEILKQTNVFINVGANYGYYCCLALQAGVHTVAFEPIDLNLRLLYKNIQVNGWQDKIEIFPLALGGGQVWSKYSGPKPALLW